jgi:hypothetical protein
MTELPGLTTGRDQMTASADSVRMRRALNDRFDSDFTDFDPSKTLNRTFSVPKNGPSAFPS